MGVQIHYTILGQCKVLHHPSIPRIRRGIKFSKKVNLFSTSWDLTILTMTPIIFNNSVYKLVGLLIPHPLHGMILQMKQRHQSPNTTMSQEIFWTLAPNSKDIILYNNVRVFFSKHNGCNHQFLYHNFVTLRSVIRLIKNTRILLKLLNNELLSMTKLKPLK